MNSEVSLEERIRRSERAKKLWSERKEEMSKAIKESWNDESNRINQLKAAKKRAKNLETKMKQSIAMKKYCNSPEAKAKRSIAMKKRWANLEERIKQSERIKKATSKLEERLKRSERTKISWSKPEERANRLKNHRSGIYKGRIAIKAKSFLLQLEENVPLDAPNREELINKLRITRMNIGV